MKAYLRHFLAAGLAIAVIGAGAAVTPAHADAVKDRVAAMKDISKANKALQAAAKAGDKATVEKQAKIIVAAVEKLPDLFPKGTDNKTLDPKSTRAKPEIWAKWDEFKAASEKLKSAAMQVASAGDMAAAARTMGSACGSCHKVFRGPKAK